MLAAAYCISICYSFRTLATDAGFQHVVSEDMLLRLLDAFVWQSVAGQLQHLWCVLTKR